MALVEVKVPDIGDFKEVAVIELLVKPGDVVKAEQSLITVESDKASMEIPSSHAGVVKELKVKLGDKVGEGSLVLLLDAEGGAPSAAPAPAPTPAAAVAAPAAPAATGSVEVRVPDIGDFKDVAVIELFVKPGDTVKLEQSLITVESDKASMEIPSSAAGVIKELKVKLGDKVNIGDLLAIVEGATAAPAPAPVAAAPASAAVAPASATVAVPAAAAPLAASVAAAAPAAHNPTSAPVGLPHASPSVRKFARELGVPLEEIKGTGPKGRITQEDVQSFTKAVMSGAAQTRAQAAKAPAGGAAGGGEALGLIPWPKVDFAKFGPIERKEMSRIKKISGANLLRNAIMIPAVTNHDDADITDLEAFRVQLNKENEKSGIKVTMLAFLIKACVAAL
ncbi:MAG: dihydrolipoamide acetyltransferase, partial [Betaproteobacteria bacterium]|nr:dihydrolipoamide acetyltransferase [Betaproteobacteria bacterium]